jgi:S-layer family protein
VYDISAASDRAGNFTVAWENPDGSDRGVFARRFTAAGVPRGAQFRVNTATTSLQRYPDVASDPAGNLLAAWTSLQNGMMMEIYGQRFGGLVPAGLSLSDGGNGVLEVDESFTLVPSWRNVNGAPQTFQGHVSATSIPQGLTLTLTPDATYGTVANGATASCSACYVGSVTGARPIGHVDAIVFESIVPEVQGQVKRWAVHVGDSFSDVPRASPFYRFVETLFHHDITSGCIGNQFCPAGVTTREQMAPFLLVAREGAGYSPPGCISSVFADVPPTSIYCPFIEELWRRGVVGGCGGNNYCPTAAVTREQMAVFVLRTLDPALDPPACGTPVFNDVPASSPFCRWIEELARRGIVGGCGGGSYCPTSAVTREQMSVFLSATFGLTLYGP